VHVCSSSQYRSVRISRRSSDEKHAEIWHLGIWVSVPHPRPGMPRARAGAHPASGSSARVSAGVTMFAFSLFS